MPTKLFLCGFFLVDKKCRKLFIGLLFKLPNLNSERKKKDKRGDFFFVARGEKREEEEEEEEEEEKAHKSQKNKTQTNKINSSL